jgi:hypothetical protein
MAKKGQHQNDANDKTKSKGHNNPDKSTTIATGSYKKPETYAEQARAHEDPGKQAQAAKNTWNEDTRDQVSTEGSPRARIGDLSRSGRAHGSGSDSNASSGTRGY